LPLGILLSYAAFLPAMLGLFFFLLFGLVLGAALFRAWEPLRPVPRSRIARAVLAVALFGWVVSLVWEGLTFPHQTSKEAIEQVRREVPGKSAADIRAAAESAARTFLAERFPPGGVLGYWRWAATGRRVEIPILGVAQPQPIYLGHTRAIFLVRVVLSLVAMWSGIRVMVKPLERPRIPEDEAPASPTLT
jgi:hypothetical protein